MDSDFLENITKDFGTDMESKSYNIFPIVVKSVKYPKHDELKQYLMEEPTGLLHNSIPYEENQYGTRSYWQNGTDKFFFRGDKHPIVQDFHQFCKEQLLEYARQDMAYDMDEMLITQSWINVYKNSGQNIHSHVNSFFSGNYFLNYNAAHSPFLIYNPSKTTGSMRPLLAHDRVQEKLTSSQFDFLEIKLSEGDLFLFPSHLYHSVDHKDNDGRITISMNSMPSEVKYAAYRFKIQEN